MSTRYTLRVADEFAAAHRLREYPGDCSRLHGHNWHVEVEVEASELDSVGMGLDFRRMRRALESVLRPLDHGFLNEIAPFDRINPTAENIAAHCFRAVAEQLDTATARVIAVTVRENDRAGVRYTEQET